MTHTKPYLVDTRAGLWALGRNLAPVLSAAVFLVAAMDTAFNALKLDLSLDAAQVGQLVMTAVVLASAATFVALFHLLSATFGQALRRHRHYVDRVFGSVGIALLGWYFSATLIADMQGRFPGLLAIGPLEYAGIVLALVSPVVSIFVEWLEHPLDRYNRGLVSLAIVVVILGAVVALMINQELLQNP